jgi:acetyl-CoA carboxylase carboxyl transferase subunit alpha
LPTPIICVVIGEGGSGGALGIGVGDRVAMLEHAYYSVISPEGCAGILWKSHTFKERAAEALKMTSKDLMRLGLIDKVIDEPLGGAHRNHHLAASRLKQYLRGALRDLTTKPLDMLVDERYRKFRRMGVFLEGGRPNRENSNAATASSVVSSPMASTPFAPERVQEIIK